MRNLFNILFFEIFVLISINAQDCYVQHTNSSGIMYSESSVTTLNEDACELINFIPSELTTEFRVFSFSYYTHNEQMDQGRIDAIFDQQKIAAESASEYFFLIGKQISQGKFTDFKIHLNLPISEEYPCLTQESLGQINSFLNNTEIDLPISSELELLTQERELIDQLKGHLNHHYFCCPLLGQTGNRSSNNGSPTCSPYLTLEQLFLFIQETADDERLAYCRYCNNAIDNNSDINDIYTYKEGFFMCQILDLYQGQFIDIEIGEVINDIYNNPATLIKNSNFETLDNIDEIDNFPDLIYYANQTGTVLCYPESNCYPEEFCNSSFPIENYSECLQNDLQNCTFSLQSKSLTEESFTKIVDQTSLEQEINSLQHFMSENYYNGVYYYYDEVTGSLFRTDLSGSFIPVIDKQAEIDLYNELNVSTNYNYGIWMHYNSDSQELTLDFKLFESNINLEIDPRNDLNSEAELAEKMKDHAYDLSNNYSSTPESILIDHDQPPVQINEDNINDGQFKAISASILKYGGFLLETGKTIAETYRLPVSMWDDENDGHDPSLINIYAPIAGPIDASVDELSSTAQLVDLSFEIIKNPSEIKDQFIESVRNIDFQTINTMAKNSWDKISGNNGKTQQSYSISFAATAAIWFYATGGFTDLKDFVFKGPQKIKNIKDLLKTAPAKVKEAVEGLPELLKGKFFDDFNSFNLNDWVEGMVNAWESPSQHQNSIHSLTSKIA